MRFVITLVSRFVITSLAVFATVSASAETKEFADVVVKLTDASLEKKAAGIRTLYVTLYDEASKMPMPFGALKVELKADAKGEVFKGRLDTNNVVVMGGGAWPASLRIKARLDKDGSAGSDAPGDLLGIVTGVKQGSATTIVIDKAM